MSWSHDYWPKDRHEYIRALIRRDHVSPAIRAARPIQTGLHRRMQRPVPEPGPAFDWEMARDYWPIDKHDYLLGLIRDDHDGTLPPWAIAHDLVYLAQQAHLTGAAFPGRRVLAERWGTGEVAARRALSDPGWRKTARAEGLEVPDRAPVPAPPDRIIATGRVYFVSTNIPGSPVKVGYTSASVASRLHELQVGSAHRLVVLGEVEGPPNLERRAHRSLKAHRLHGEWFERTAALELLAQLRRGGQ